MLCIPYRYSKFEISIKINSLLLVVNIMVNLLVIKVQSMNNTYA